jgi:hypothetical protein
MIRTTAPMVQTSTQTPAVSRHGQWPSAPVGPTDRRDHAVGRDRHARIAPMVGTPHRACCHGDARAFDVTRAAGDRSTSDDVAIEVVCQTAPAPSSHSRNPSGSWGLVLLWRTSPDPHAPGLWARGPKAIDRRMRTSAARSIADLIRCRYAPRPGGRTTRWSRTRRWRWRLDNVRGACGRHARAAGVVSAAEDSSASRPV